MDKVFLSIVIPVYNGAETITRCLDSIWGQGLPADKYEVICVDDGSTDNTSEVIKSVQLLHSNLHLYRNETNLRAGGSRNRGVREAKGEYILFIDADDYFHNGALVEVREYLKTENLDILVCDFARHTVQDVNNELVHKFKSEDVMTGREFLVVNSLPYAPWKYIFKKNLMISNNVLFEEKVSCEDIDWSHEIAFYAQKMQYRPILLTHYILTDVSQTAVEYKNPNTVFHRLKAGYRMSRLIDLYETEVEKECIKSVTIGTLKNGVIFLNALCSSPAQKANVIKECLPSHQDLGTMLNWVRRNAYLYSCFSSFVSPLFRSAVWLKRKVAGR